MLSEATPQGTVSSTYDAAGRRTSMTVAGQPAVNYTFDNANRLAQITQGTSTVSFAYDAANRRTTLTLPNGIIVSYGYDGASELSGITYQLGGTTLGNLSYAYDLTGRRVSTGGSLARTGLPLAVTTTAYNADNQLTQWGTATLTYDADGNMLSSGSDGYTWDARNHLVSTLSGASFQYDSFGRRVRKTITGVTTNFLYDGANVVQELSGTTPTANLLSGGIDEVFLRTDAAGARHFLADALGSTLALTDGTGTVQTQYTYEPFGNTTLSGSTSANPYQYTGRENDGTGLYFYRARFYSPALQRFISEDPIGFDGGTNLYAYVGNSPIGFADPLGLKPRPRPWGLPSWLPWPGGSPGGGPGGSPGGDPPPQPKAPNNGPCSNGVGSGGAGVGAGYNLDLGAGIAGASSTGGAGAGLFHNGAGGVGSGYSGGAFASGADTAYAGSHIVGAPTQTSSTTFSLGAYAGIGPNVFVTNAASSQQLAGPFTTVSINVGYGVANFGAQLSFGGGIWQLSITPPVVSVGIGAAGSVVTTNTVATHTGCH